MQDELLQAFSLEYTKHMNSMRHEEEAKLQSYRRQLSKLTKQRESLVQSLKDGIPAHLIKDDLIRVSAQLEETESTIKVCSDQPMKPLLHPSMATRY